MAMAVQQKRRIAVLGGGVAGLSAAYQLTQPNQPNPPEVTVYQLGWRLGGKCASGRDQTAGDRVQEHGLHVFFGFYDNAFAMLRECYQQLDLSGDRFKTIWDALAPYDQITVMEEIDGKQVPWVIDCPELPGRPGDPDPPSLWSTIIASIEWLLHTHASIVDGLESDQPAWARVCASLEGAKRLALALGEVIGSHAEDDHTAIASLIRSAAADVADRVAAQATLDDKMRRLLTLFDFGAANTLGAIADGIARDPYGGAERIDAQEYRDWLSSHSVLHLAENSAVLRALYDLIFAYPGGDVTAKGDVAAGAMLLGLFQLWQFRGSVLWKMRAGTGDIVAAPLYKLLRQRGVHFEFFSRVDDVAPSKDGRSIDTVTIGRQVTLKTGTYDPLFRCNDLDCWPAMPLYDQIVQGDELKRRQIDLESPWTDWADAGGTLCLQRGRDFDDVVLAISVAALPRICSKLGDADGRWRAMFEQVGTVETMSVQLWFDRTLSEMGWTGKDGTLLGGYDVSQLDTWADISEVLASEGWGAGAPKNASILVGPMKGPATPPPPGDRDYPAQAQKSVVDEAKAFLEKDSAVLWPALNRAGFDWSALHADAGLQGEQRLMAQYLRANIAPTERYVLSRAGTIEARLRADDSGFANLALAGDWTDNPQNLGGFEATVMSGMLASRALTGLPKQILRVPPDHPLMVPPPSSPPRFVDHVGMQTFPGRVDFTGVTMSCYFMQADYGKLLSICRTFFDEPSGGAVSCVPLSNWIMLSFADMGHGRFASRPEMGWSTEKELAFWIFVGRLKSPGSDEIDEAFLYNPYLCLDNPVAMLTGREVFGFEKQEGWVDLPAPGAAKPVFSTDVFGTNVPGPAAEWTRVPLLTLDGSTAIADPGMALNDLGAVVKRLGQDMPRFALQPGLPLIAEFLDDFLHGRAPIAFLKQFRDIQNPALCCYQGICSADMHITGFHGATLMNPGKLTVHPVVNLPIADVFGMPAAGATGLGVQLSLDMSLYPGREIWRAEQTK